MTKYRFSFSYDKRGYGYLILYIKGMEYARWYSRSGSCNESGKLVNAIKAGVWSGKEAPVLTKEEGMVYDGFGWKWRLWTPAGKWSHYLIHPDGNKPGTKGCIGLQKTDGRDLYTWLKKVYEDRPDTVINLGVGTPEERLKMVKKEVILTSSKYSVGKGIAKGLKSAIVAGISTAGVTSATVPEESIPLTAIVSVITWGISILLNWFKNK